MPIYYLDTSAIMKRYISEPGSNVVRELFEKLTDSDELTTSYLTLLEVNSTATRLLKGSIITSSGYRRILNQFNQDISSYSVTLVPVQHELIDRAIVVANEYFLRSLDAMHFASAIVANEMSSGGQATYIVSADREIIAACEAYGIPTLNPQSNDALDRLTSLRP